MPGSAASASRWASPCEARGLDPLHRFVEVPAGRLPRLEGEIVGDRDLVGGHDGRDELHRVAQVKLGIGRLGEGHGALESVVGVLGEVRGDEDLSEQAQIGSLR